LCFQGGKFMEATKLKVISDGYELNQEYVKTKKEC
jgi:hypothetical protein